MRPLISILALLVLPGAAMSGEKASPVASASDQARKVLRAYRAKRNGVLGELAGADAPDPWMVAHHLCRQGKFDAASAFGALVRVPIRDSLVRYIGNR